MAPKKISTTPDRRLSVLWDDGHEELVPLESLRDGCPCAGCQGETVLLRTAPPLPQDRTVPGRYQLVGASAVGLYALQCSWGDGHATGIYTWEYLRSLCECSSCTTLSTNEHAESL